MLKRTDSGPLEVYRAPLNILIQNVLMPERDTDSVLSRYTASRNA